MGIYVHLPSTFRCHVGGADCIECLGNNVAECLSDLTGKYPTLKEQIFDKSGALKKVLEIYVNGKSAYPRELEKELKDGDNVFITLMLAGG